MANKNNQALLNLKVYQSKGLSYFEATQRLKHDGFTQTEITNATTTLKNNKDEVLDRPQLATELLAVNKVLQKQQEKRLNGVVWHYGTGIPFSTPEYISSWWPLVVMMVFLIVLLYFLF